MWKKYFVKRSKWCHWNKMTLSSRESDDAAKEKNNSFKKIDNVRWKLNDYIIEFMIYNHWFVSLKMMIKLLNNFKTTFFKHCTFVIIFQFIIDISILWQLSKHDRMIEKTMLTIQYTNSREICSKLVHKKKGWRAKTWCWWIWFCFFHFVFCFFFMWPRIVLFVCVEMTKWRCDAALFLSTEKVFHFGVWY